MNLRTQQAEKSLEARGPGDATGGVPLLGVVPDHELWDPSGAQTQFYELIDQTSIFLFVDSDCQPCRRLLSELETRDEAINGTPLFVVLNDSTANRRLIIPLHVRALFQREGASSKAFGTNATPHAFVIYPGGTVLDRLVPRSAEDLVRAAERQQRGGEQFEDLNEGPPSAASGLRRSVLSSRRNG